METLYLKIDWRISPWIFSLLFFGNNSVHRIIVLVWMYAGCMWIQPYVLLVEEMQIQPLFWHHVELLVNKPLLNVVSNEMNKDVRMYTWRIYSSRYLDTLLYMEHDWICIGNAVVYIQCNNVRERMRLLSDVQIDTVEWIELQWSENMSTCETNVWIAIPLFGAFMPLGGVNGNLHWLFTHQTAEETIECHSCN